MKKLINFGLENGTYGLGTEEEIQEMCKDWNTRVYRKELATYKEVEDYICLGGEIPENQFLEVKNGYVIINSDTDELDFYSKKIVCTQMLECILETYI
ncbi:hypothetical protein CLOACE_18800 [Clostridium acetireducens DSM 10703]|uniref:Uncharacterized protein n=1 Tax=Clostridium acetireducens DSM 10703 TaxID=1121290 RepID=A0A1E8EWY0_9CLOT|nr:hypothetical protein [Clostridium acetireducens]OFI05262.1 hypothetical protein CLOACE_18800 [Clostridium acetireducens DSM 10703]